MARTYPFCCQWGPVTPEGTCGLVDSWPTGNVHCKCRRAGLVLRWAALPLPGPLSGAVAVTRCLSRWHYSSARPRASARCPAALAGPRGCLPMGVAAGSTGIRVPSHWHRPGGIMMMMIPLAAGAWPSIPGDGPNWPRHWQLVAASASWRGSG
jgi:hypothetical protein